MIDEYEEFHAYTKPVQYTAAGKRDTTWVGRFTFDMLLKFEGFARILPMIARGYMYGENAEPDIDRAHRALCTWCSVPDSKKASPQKDWQFSTVFSDLHEEFPELVDENGVGWLVRHVRNLCAFARNNPSVISKPAQKHCETLSRGFEADWRRKVAQFQVPIFSEKTKGAWVLRFDDVLADALELGPLRRPEIFFFPKQMQRIEEVTPKGLPVEVMTTLIAYYIANRQDDTDWVVLPVANFDAYFGRSFSHIWLNKLPEGAIIRERDKGRGVCRYRLGLGLLEQITLLGSERNSP